MRASTIVKSDFKANPQVHEERGRSHLSGQDAFPNEPRCYVHGDADFAGSYCRTWSQARGRQTLGLTKRVDVCTACIASGAHSIEGMDLLTVWAFVGPGAGDLASRQRVSSILTKCQTGNLAAQAIG